MFDRTCLRNLFRISSVLPLALIAPVLVLTFVGCSNSQIDSITVTPSTQTLAAASTVQFTAMASVGHAGHPTQNVTDKVTWTSSAPSIATVSSTGLATGVAGGTVTITASSNGFGGLISATATLTVTGGSGGGGGGGLSTDLQSIQVVPGTITVSNKGMTGQFLAFGTYGTAPTVRDLTNTVTWISTSPEVASIVSGGTTGEAGGVATAQGYTGNSTIYAEATAGSGSVVLSNSETFTCLDQNTSVCNQAVAHPQFATITVFNAGENTTTWEITAPSDTGQPNLIHCGPGSTTGSVCTGTYETGSTVVLTESPTGSGFGGWSSGDGSGGIGCTPATGYTLLNSPTCTVTLTGNTSIGGIFY